MSPESVINKLLEVIVTLDLGLEDVQELMFKLTNKFNLRYSENNDIVNCLETKIHVLERTIGPKALEFSAQFSSPTLSDSICMLLDKIEASTPNQFRVLPSSLNPTGYSIGGSNLILSHLNPLKTRIDAIELHSTSPSNSGITSNDMSTLLKTMLGIQTRLEFLETKNKPQVVDFGCVYFEDLEGAVTWMDDNLDPDDFSLVVDPHIVMEHVHSNLETEDYLSESQRMCKLKVETLSQAISITSYERSVPKILNSEKPLGITGDVRLSGDSGSGYH